MRNGRNPREQTRFEGHLRQSKARRTWRLRSFRTCSLASQSDRSPAEKPHWRTALTTEDKQKALDMAKEIGDKVRVEEIRYRW
jgi:hypothetical protein